ncbi:MAG: hypothetical protein CSA31_02485 [Desulfobulbus propionicus]|nr:MAG: hypothetical protein CSA31_02485 [Desulfobulbus propionicus]
MITYLYWIGIILLAGVLLFGLGVKAKNWKVGGILAVIVLITGWGTYSFRLEQMFVKRYGGEMTIKVPDGQYHIGMTWKDDNLWIENYDPDTDRCYFTEYSKGNLLQGRVIIKNCRPFKQ